jgi:cytochrome c oxidase subunit 1
MSNAGANNGGTWLTTSDHKRVGLQFLYWTLGAFLLGSLYSVILKLRVGSGLVEPALYRQMLTQHGLLMVFLFLVPAIPSVLGHYLLPLQLGARGMALPSFTKWSLRLHIIGTVLFVLSVMLGAVDARWTFVTPASLAGEGAFGLMAVALAALGLSWFSTGVNFIVTVHRERAAGMGFFDMPVFSWSLYLTGFILTLTGVLFAIIMLYLASSRAFGKGLFAAGADPLLWQNYFWFVTTPAAFFALLPAVGVVTEVIAGMSRRPVVGYRTLVGALIALLGLGFVTWGVRLVGAGQAPEVSFVFAAFSVLTAVPAALIAYSWLATLYRGAVACAAPVTFSVAFILQAGIGVVMGLFLSSLALGAYLANTLFVTAQIHYVMMGGVLTAFLAGLHYWWPKMTGRTYSNLLGRLSGFTYLLGLNLAFLPQVIAGAQGVPQGLSRLPEGLGGLDLVSNIGMWVLISGLVMIISNLFGSLHDGARAGDNPWGAATLEWKTSSPPPAGNFEQDPAVGEPYAY